MTLIHSINLKFSEILTRILLSCSSHSSVYVFFPLPSKFYFSLCFRQFDYVMFKCGFVCYISFLHLLLMSYIWKTLWSLQILILSISYFSCTLHSCILHQFTLSRSCWISYCLLLFNYLSLCILIWHFYWCFQVHRFFTLLHNHAEIFRWAQRKFSYDIVSSSSLCHLPFPFLC